MTDESVPVPLAVRTSDLKVRTLSAVVMLAVAGGALWAGGWWWTAFVALVAAGVLWEWVSLVRKFATGPGVLAVWLLAGVGYVGGAAWSLVQWMRNDEPLAVILVAGAVVMTDIGAYFAGRTIGGPKIAPRISPSKTWAGLGGGIVAATMFLSLVTWAGLKDISYFEVVLAMAIFSGFLIAILAQAGDFFESWMKRRAGVKDSGNLLPGHGGLFDRVDGLLAVAALGYPLLSWLQVA